MKWNRFSSVLLVLAIVATLFAGCGGSKLTVDFDWNYITDEAPPAAIEVSGTYGSLPEVAENARPGFTFDGWYLNAAGNGQKITADTLVAAEANHTLFAKWTGHKYTVSFDLQGGTINGVSSVDDAMVTCGNVYSMMAIPDDPERDNHTFLGWYYDAECTQKVTWPISMNPNANYFVGDLDTRSDIGGTGINLYAGWTLIGRTLKFVSNGDTTLPSVVGAAGVVLAVGAVSVIVASAVGVPETVI